MVNSMKETEIGLIPSDWDIKKIEPCIGIVKSGKRLPKGYSLSDVPNSHPYIRVADMMMGHIDEGDIKYVPEEVVDVIEQYKIYDNDVYISVAGTLGLVGKVPPRLNGANLTENANKITDIKCNQDYLMYWLMSNYIKRQIESTQTIGAQPKLALERIRNFLVPLPSTEEQNAIAETLSDVDELISVFEKEIEKKKNIKTGVMQRYLSGDERLPGFTSKWDIKSIDELCVLVTKQTGFDYSAEIKPSLVQVNYNNTLPFLQNKDFEGYKINFDTDFYIPISVAYKYPKILLDEVCLLISISGRIGNAALFNNDRSAFVGGAVGVAKFKNSDLVEWAMLYLLSPNGQKMIFENEKAGAQHNLTVEDVRNFSIPIPEKDERIAITSMMADMEKDICQLEEKINKYKNLKAGMMDDLLTGKIGLV